MSTGRRAQKLVYDDPGRDQPHKERYDADLLFSEQESYMLIERRGECR